MSSGSADSCNRNTPEPTRSDKPHSSGEARKLLARTRGRDQTLSGAERSAVAAAAIGATALGARPEVEEAEAEAEREEAGRGKRSLEVEGPEEEEEEKA